MATTSTVAQIDPADELTINGRWDYARTIARADDLIPKALWSPVQDPNTGGMLPPKPSAGKIMLVMEVGRMLGMHPLAAINGVHVIEGKATISPAMMSAKVRNEGHRLRVFMEGNYHDGTLTAVAQLVRSDDPDFTFETRWTPSRAERAGLGTYRQTPAGWEWKSDKANWRNYLEAMLKARAIGEVCREGAEDALMGAQYTPEELGATVTEEGEVPVQPAPSRDWSAAINAATTTGELGTLLAELQSSPDFTPELFSALIARSGMLGVAEAAAATAPAAAATAPPEPADDVVDAEVIPDDADAPADDEHPPADAEPVEYAEEVDDDEPSTPEAPAEPTAADGPNAGTPFGPEAEQRVRELAERAAAARRRPFDASAMGGTK